jgi:ribosomal 30S subunit maturation factor RimM
MKIKKNVDPMKSDVFWDSWRLLNKKKEKEKIKKKVKIKKKIKKKYIFLFKNLDESQKTSDFIGSTILIFLLFLEF